MTASVLPPVGKRPKCLFCVRELRPVLKRDWMPYLLSDADKKIWRKEHPPVFEGRYGSYGDSRFCGLRCGYDYALRVTAKRP